MEFSVAATNVGVLLFRAAVEMNAWVSFSKARRGIIYLASEKGAVALRLGIFLKCTMAGRLSPAHRCSGCMDVFFWLDLRLYFLLGLGARK